MSDGGVRKRLPAARRRASILEAAREIFLKSGYAGARTREIAHQAGIAEAMLYRHFASKDEIFEQAIVEPLETVIAGIVERSARLRSQDADREQEFAELNEYVLEEMVKLVPLLGVALFADQDAGKQLYRDRIHPLLQDWMRLSERGLKDVDRRDVDTEFVFTAFFGMMFYFALDSIFRDAELDVHRVAVGVEELILYGVTRGAGNTSPAPKTRRRASARR